jgi:N-acetylmuramoyl-L-alanine amidase
MRRAVQIFLLVLAPLAVFAAMIAADRAFGQAGRGHGYVQRVTLPPAGGELGLPAVAGPLDASRPLVVIDPGHGGRDPGAGTAALYEKDLTLRLAQALRDELLRRGGVRVALTRSDDSYLFLPERSGIARRLGADLFISIHADSTASDSGASGASVYTLSAKGSNEVAERIAARENAVDTINGVAITDTDDVVSAILVDLSQRDAQAGSELFSSLVFREAAARLKFRDSSAQSAAFAVLKAPDIPSVLFEVGYINNADDAGRLASAAGRQAFAESTARAIEVFFARQSLR